MNARPFEYSTPSSSGFEINGYEFYFSYQTCIAVRTPNGTLYIRENDWSTTTGRHLNDIDRNHARRINGAIFEKVLSSIDIQITHCIFS